MEKCWLLVCIYLLFGALSVCGQSLDLRLLQSINGPANGNDNSWRNFSNSVNITSVLTPVSMFTIGLATHNKELTIKAFETTGALLISEGLKTGLKSITHRERPYLEYPGLITGKDNSTDYSFPSGHTSAAFATAASLSLSFPKWYVIVPSFTYASAIGYSRLYLGVHYPSDVAAGAVVGVGSAILSWELQKLLNKKYHYH